MIVFNMPSRDTLKVLIGAQKNGKPTQEQSLLESGD